VFDTVLTRIWTKPTDLFWELGCQLQKENLIPISAEAWCTLRIEAEKNARDSSAKEDITLQQIYDKIVTLLDWTRDDVEKAKQKELNLELSSLRPVPSTQRKIQALHQQNQRVIYISDMYLPLETIKLFLKEHNIWAEGDVLYVSSKSGVTKGSGKLFQQCLAKESIAASQLNHIGDNFHSDVKAAKKLGIKAQLFTQTHLNRYEQLISQNNQAPLKFRSLLAGASRLTRLQCQEDDRHRQVIWETATSVIAPLLVGFVNWCLKEADSKGIQRLYFVARDGQILHKIAKILCKNWGYGIDCRYLYGSRQAWRFPVIDSLSQEHLVCWTVRSACDEVNIRPEQIKTLLLRHGFPEEMWERELDKQDQKLLKQVFQEPEISNLVIATAKNCRSKIISYFKQEGLDDGIPFGLVDIGWRCSLQKALSDLLCKAGIYPENGTYGFYFGVQRHVKGLPTDRSFAYYYDVANSSARRRQFGEHIYEKNLLEVFTAADHGSTIRFEKDGGKYIPILRETINSKALNWGLRVQQEAIVKFTENFSSVIHIDDCKPELFLYVCESVLETFIDIPSREEASSFGSFNFAGDSVERIWLEIAPELTFSLFLKLLIKNEFSTSHMWKQGIMYRSQKIIYKFMLTMGTLLKHKTKIMKQ
ncbi:MAG TPA: hypothetical protein VFE71_10360, partial [Bacteroidales bacterium]|nr:hypothetical protein [Bacteroidales bacterium]